MLSRIGLSAALRTVIASLAIAGCTTFTIGPAPVPTIASLSPNNVTAGSQTFDLIINGTGYVSGFTEVRFGSVRYRPHELRSVTANMIVLRIGASFVANAGMLTVTVVNRVLSTGGGGTATATFTINNPPPTVSSVTTNLPPPNDRNSVPAEGPPFRMLVSGGNFVPGSLIRWDGIARITSYVSPNQVATDVTTGDLAVSRTVQVGVLNPAPGGGQSPTTMPFTIYAVLRAVTFVGILPWFQVRVTFDDPPPPMAEAPLDGLYPRPPSSLPPRLDFPAGQWEWADETVNNVRVRDAFFSAGTAFPATRRSFSFANGPRVLAGVDVITKTAGTLTLNDGSGRSVTQAIAVGGVQTIATGWFNQPSATITVEFDGGRSLGITAISYLGLP